MILIKLAVDIRPVTGIANWIFIRQPVSSLQANQPIYLAFAQKSEASLVVFSMVQL